MEGVKWRKTSHSSANGENCVEVACIPANNGVYVRDSKHQNGPAHALTTDTWCDFIDRVKRGELDL